MLTYSPRVVSVSRILPQRIRAFAESKRALINNSLNQSNRGVDNPVSTDSDIGAGTGGGGGQAELRHLSQLLKAMPEYQKEVASFSAIYNIADSCMAQFRAGVDKLCEVEQEKQSTSWMGIVDRPP
ncbi:unnamed protein product [Protopolystoma xenopodis]|uniref:Uncharacterized protein n=1 Tax=Protopolystoma xenopodis TaxID=117903 RepID=A0A3S5API1_9PLAT|nr:unnamed protein product [Protopolystoma xenopodis]